MLESFLERRLQELGMPLGERQYAEDLDYEARVADLFSSIKSTEPLYIRTMGMILGRISMVQLLRGSNPMILRTASPYNGLGFSYEIRPRESFGEENPAKISAGRVIKNRDFGTGCETLVVHYSPDFSKTPHFSLYNSAESCQLNFSVDKELNIGIENIAEEEEKKSRMTPVLKQIERLKGEKVSEETLSSLGKSLGILQLIVSC